MDYIVYLLVLLILLCGGILIYINRKSVKKLQFISTHIAPGQDALLKRNPANPSPILTLSFEESLHVDVFIKKLRDFSLNYVDEIFKEIYQIKRAPEKSFRLIEEVKATRNSDTIIWKLSEEGKKLLKKGRIEWNRERDSRTRLPRILTEKGEKVRRMFKGADPGKIARLTKLAHIAVNAAHIISGSDQARELRVIDKKIDYLLAARKIDQLSKLESNFYLAKELLSNPVDSTNKSKILDLHREIIEMRTNWRNEIEQKLENIEDPNSRSFFNKLFTTQKSRDKQVTSEISEFEEEIALIDFSFIYDIALCESIGHINSSLEAEINRLEKTKDLLRQKVNHLSGSNDGYRIDTQIKQLDRIISRYRKFLPG